uniref:Uncharacterized protein n=1 Tax=Rhizophora mucronata TaxID=61149 RepID=A0A2P2P7U1_RHIMU
MCILSHLSSPNIRWFWFGILFLFFIFLFLEVLWGDRKILILEVTHIDKKFKVWESVMVLPFPKLACECTVAKE